MIGDHVVLGDRVILKDCVVVAPHTVIPADTVIPPFTHVTTKPTTITSTTQQISQTPLSPATQWLVQEETLELYQERVYQYQQKTSAQKQ
jgi:UDP-3-O-[3-hydroxymyristoyl] glucosamine N-acyltransferase